MKNKKTISVLISLVIVIVVLAVFNNSKTCSYTGCSEKKHDGGEYCDYHSEFYDGFYEDYTVTEENTRAQSTTEYVTEFHFNEDDYTTTTQKHYTTRKKSTTTYPYDEYDVYDYSNEEDFYYDHYDDFFDYYDAEDYYNDAWDKVE